MLTGITLSCSNQDNETRTPGEKHLFELLDANQTSIDFENTITSYDQFNIIEYLYFYNGAGVAIGDINNDSLPDIYFTGNQVQNKLYLNKGNFEFEDITTNAGVDGKGNWANGVTMADVNGDGLLDIYVSYVGDYKMLSGRNELYINNGDLTFSEEAEKYGLDFKGFGTQAVFFDYDHDSDLDVYLLNHSVHSVASYGSALQLRGQHDNLAGDRLLQSQLAQGIEKFIDVTKAAGIYSSQIGYGLGVGINDFNEDGWEDIYVSNDFHENDFLYINNQDGTFTEQLEVQLGHSSRYSMGNDLADVNHDGSPDIISTDMLPKDPNILLKSAGEDRIEVYDIKLEYGYGHQLARNTMQLNNGNGTFSDVAMYAKTFATDWSWSPLVADFDNDGYNDIHITNGIFKRPNDLDYIQYISNLEEVRYNNEADEVTREMIRKMPNLKISNAVFAYRGGLHWEERSKAWGLDQPSHSNGSAYGDLDNDGDLDLVINNVNQPAFVYRNRSSEQLNNNYIKVVLQDTSLNTYGIGARIRLSANGHVIQRFISATRGFESASELTSTIGLGQREVIDSLEVFWPLGRYTLRTNVNANQRLVLSPEDSAIKPQHKAKEALLELSDVKIDYRHLENKYNDHASEYLLPYKLSKEGPAVAVGDFNGDGREDIFFGGARGQPGEIHLQQSDGTFKRADQQLLTRDRDYEDVAAEFIDVDADNDLDLVVVSGGNEVPKMHYLLADRVYLNQNGTLESHLEIPNSRSNSSCVISLDVNSDGENEFFIGYHANKGEYGYGQGGAIYRFEGNEIIEITDTVLPELRSNHMITAACWADTDQNGYQELYIAGHWMPILRYEFKGADVVRQEISGSNGLWNSLEAADIEGNGQLTVFAGNVGQNNKFVADSEHPLKMYLHDFDNNGSLDPIIMQYVEDRYVPMFTKDELAQQVVAIKKRFPDYKGYANNVRGITDLFNADLVEEATVLEINQLNSIRIESNKIEPLADQVQLYPVNGFAFYDLNQDSLTDVLAAGNYYQMHVNLGRYDAGYGNVLLATDSAGLTPLRQDSGFTIKGQVAALEQIDINNKAYILVVRNNNTPVLFRINK